MEVISVVPIFMSAGAAVLPTVVAAVTSVAAVALKPGALIAACRRRPWTAMGSVGTAPRFGAFGVLVAHGRCSRAGLPARRRAIACGCGLGKSG